MASLLASFLQEKEVVVVEEVDCQEVVAEEQNLLVMEVVEGNLLELVGAVEEQSFLEWVVVVGE